MTAPENISTPIGSNPNLLVYGPGGYRYGDYTRVGFPLAALCMVCALVLIPLFFPLVRFIGTLTVAMLLLGGGQWVNNGTVSIGVLIVFIQYAQRFFRPFADGYGYQWWVPDHDGESPTVFAGNGYGGQFVQVVPEQDLVAVFNGWNIHGGANRSTWRALQERLIPATQ